MQAALSAMANTWRTFLGFLYKSKLQDDAMRNFSWHKLDTSIDYDLKFSFVKAS